MGDFDRRAFADMAARRLYGLDTDGGAGRPGFEEWVEDYGGDEALAALSDERLEFHDAYPTLSVDGVTDETQTALRSPRGGMALVGATTGPGGAADCRNCSLYHPADLVFVTRGGDWLVARYVTADLYESPRVMFVEATTRPFSEAETAVYDCFWGYAAPWEMQARVSSDLG